MYVDIFIESISRPWLTDARVGFDSWLTPIMTYNNEFKLHRRLFRNYFGNRSSMARFEKLEETETCRFLHQVIRSPDNLMYHIRA